nr:MFS transporter [Aquabacterium sp. J223]
MGAIAAVVSMPRLRQRLSPQQLLEGGTLLHAVCTLVIGLVPHFWVALPTMALAGFAWLAVANSLTVSAQFTLPDWVRARGMAIYQMSLMGGSAIGAALWGQVANATGVQTGLVAAAVTALALLPLLRRQRVQTAADADLRPLRLYEPPEPVLAMEPDEGPILAMVEYWIDEADAAAFVQVMQESRRSRLRLGSISWSLFRDTAEPRRWIEYFVDASWVEHLRRLERTTSAEAALREQRLAFHRGSEPPRVTRLVGQSLPK